MSVTAPGTMAAREAPAADHRRAGALLWRQYRLERRMFWRNPVAAFFNFLLPLLFLGLFGAVFAGNRKELDLIVPGIAGMSVMSTTFIALAYNMTGLREQGILKRVRGTPLPSGTYLGGLALAALTNAVIQLVIISLAGHLVFGLPWPRDVPELLLFGAAGVLCFASLGVALSHAIPSFEAAPAYVNAIFLPVLLVSGVFYDVKHTPNFVRTIAEALPLKNVIDGFSGALVTGHGIGSNTSALAIVLLWAAVGVVLAIRGFSWEQRRA
jgi:ABC-2 type transport system permease protein